MSSSDTLAALDKYVSLARRATKHRNLAGLSGSMVNPLPEVTPELIEKSYDRAEHISLQDPWHAWRMCYLMAFATQHQKADASLRARSAWNLGWAANECTEPHLAEQALERAKLLFRDVGDKGWIAACDWQLNALPWTKPDFIQAIQKLETALLGLHEKATVAFIPQCQLSLAYANILIARPDTFEKAEGLIDMAEEVFRSARDPLGVIRSGLHRASMLRRKSERIEAIRVLGEVKKASADHGAVIELAKANYQLAMNYSVLGEKIDQALSLFQQALSTFRTADLALWEAMCHYGQGMLRTRQGDYKKADQNLIDARKIFELYQIPSLLADTLNDSARVALVGGEYLLALERLKRAIDVNQKLGSTLSGTIARTNLGHTYAKSGKYQSALVHLEKALQEAEQLDNPGRLADCQLYLADVWMQLGRYQEALILLNDIEQNAPPELKALAFEAGLSKAYCLIRSHRTEEARDFILKELDRWGESQAKPDIPLLKRAMAHLLFEEDRVKAEGYLRQALADFKRLHMAEEEASCLMLLGEIYASSNRHEMASTVWKKALSKVKAGIPEIRIGCLIGLAGICEEKGKNAKALSYYRQAAQAVNDLRPDFWQPSIFSWHIARLSPFLEKAFQFLETNGYQKETIALMENLKAHTFKQELSTGGSIDHANQKRISQIRTSIEQAQQLIHSQTKGANWLAKLAKSQIGYSKIVSLIKDLEHLYGRLQREGGGKLAKFTSNFEIRRFQEVATEHLHHDWAALDYYVAGQEIIIVLVTPKRIILRTKELTPRLNIALAAFIHSNLIGQERSGDLLVLAEQLLPAELYRDLSKRQVLLISPHKTLWSVPWAGLPLIAQSGHIIDAFSPVIVPSFESLLMLWERPKLQSRRQGVRGGFIGLSNFMGSQNDLPLVLEEFDYLKSNPDIELTHLLNGQAERANVMQFLSETCNNAHEKLDFLHFATHIHYDPRSNYLCRIQLADGSVWSEEIFTSSNLPGLIFLSACNGASSFAYEGGEQTGLPLTCLVNGAQAVIGSRTAIDDKVALELTGSFYNHLIRDGRMVGDALAQAQQQLRDRGARFSDWASISCIGIPDWKL